MWEFWNFGTRSRNSIPRSKIHFHCHPSFLETPEKPVGIANSVLQKCSNSRLRNITGKVPKFAPRRSCLGAGFVAFAKRRGFLEDAKFRPKTPGCLCPHSRCRKLPFGNAPSAVRLGGTRPQVLSLLHRDCRDKTLWRSSFFEFCPSVFCIWSRKSCGCRMLQLSPRMKHRFLGTIGWFCPPRSRNLS